MTMIYEDLIKKKEEDRTSVDKNKNKKLTDINSSSQVPVEHDKYVTDANCSPTNYSPQTTDNSKSSGDNRSEQIVNTNFVTVSTSQTSLEADSEPKHPNDPQQRNDPLPLSPPQSQQLEVNSITTTNTIIPTNTTTTTKNSSTINNSSNTSKKNSDLQPTKAIKSNSNNFKSSNVMTMMESSSCAADETKLFSLLQDSMGVSFLESFAHRPEFVASTPYMGQRGSPQFVCGGTTPSLYKHSILPIVTPQKENQMIEIPDRVDFPEVCCVLLGQRTVFPVKNKRTRGVKCVFTVTKAYYNGNPMNTSMCPFETKPHVTLQPKSTESVEVWFTPKVKGHFSALLAVFTQSLMDLSDCQNSMVVLQAIAEDPTLLVSPKSDLLDFGEVVWGQCAYRSIKVQNIGRATVPIRLSIFRTASSLCRFDFCTDQSCDVSTISLTAKPEGLSSVVSKSLPGIAEGEGEVAEGIGVRKNVHTHEFKICCQVNDVQNAEKKYNEKSERFSAVADLAIDVPVSSGSHLSRTALNVCAGMVKLHTDISRLDFYCQPGKVKTASMKVINSGNITMHLNLLLRPALGCFILKDSELSLQPKEHTTIKIEYRPRFGAIGEEDEAVLFLCDQHDEYRIPMSGKTKLPPAKIKSSASSISFGELMVGQTKKQKFTFVLYSRDCDVKIDFKDCSNANAFALYSADSKREKSVTMNVKDGVKNVVYIEFQPTCVQSYSQQMSVQVVDGESFTVPLSGFGKPCLVENPVERKMTSSKQHPLAPLHTDQNIMASKKGQIPVSRHGRSMLYFLLFLFFNKGL